MLVKYCYTDSGTGESDFFTIRVDNMSVNSFEMAFNKHIAQMDIDAEIQFWELKSLINHGDNWAATFVSKCPYFGNVIITGIVYTNFKQ